MARRYQWVDLDGEGLSGILTEQADGWFYKRNLSPINTRHENGRETVAARFAPVERVAQKPSLAASAADASSSWIWPATASSIWSSFEGPTPGFYERTRRRALGGLSCPSPRCPISDWDNPNLKFVDLTGDGHADILISEDEVFCWHPSLAEAGFGSARARAQGAGRRKGTEARLRRWHAVHLPRRHVAATA